MKILIMHKKCIALISYKYGMNSRNVGCTVCFFRVFHLTSVRREVKGECVLVEMMYVFDEISLTLNPELVCHDKNVLIIKVAYVLHLGK